MSARNEQLVVQQFGSAAIGVDSCDVRHVVAVRLEPMDGRDLLAEHEVLGAGIETHAVAGRDRTVVADLVGAAVRFAGGAAVQAVAAPAVVGVPGGVARLEHDVVQGTVVAHDEGNVVLAGDAVLPDEVRDVDARDGGRRDRPRRGDAPVSRIDQSDGGVDDRRRLDRRGLLERGDQARAESAVIPQPIDVDPVTRGRRVDLERNHLPAIDADVGRESFDRRGTAVGEVPLGAGVARQKILLHDEIGHSNPLLQRSIDCGASSERRRPSEVLDWHVSTEAQTSSRTTPERDALVTAPKCGGFDARSEAMLPDASRRPRLALRPSTCSFPSPSVAAQGTSPTRTSRRCSGRRVSAPATSGNADSDRPASHSRGPSSR